MPRDAQTTDAQCRIRLVPVADEGKRLVRPGVEGANDDLPAGEGVEHSPVGVDLRLHRRCGVPAEVQHLGAEQAHALRVRGRGLERVGDRPDVDQQRDVRAVGGSTGTGRCDGCGARGGSGRDTLQDALRRVDDHLARGPVDDHLPTVVQARGRGAADHGRDAELLGQDRGVACRAAEFGDEAQDLRRIQHGGVGRCEVERDQHGRIGEDGYAGHRHTREQGDRAMPDVLEIRNPLAEIAADRAQCLGESEKPLVHRPSRRAAARHKGGDLLVELRILRHHRLGLEDVLRGTARSGAASPQEVGDVGERGNGPFGLQLRILDRAARRRIRWRRGEPDHGAGDRPRTDPDSVQDLRHHRLTSTLMVIGSGTSGSRPSCGQAAPDST